MAFYVPMHTIIEAIQYDGTIQRAGEIEEWAKLKIPERQRIKAGIIFGHIAGGFCIVTYGHTVPLTHWVCRGDYVVIENGAPKVVPGKVFDLKYVQIPS
jgi:hypothetical protein